MFTVHFALADYKIEVALPVPGGGGPAAGTPVSLTDYIRYVYLFGLGLVGIAALGALVYGGFTYMLSGTITSQDEAKKYIWGAISGLVLALAAYLILNTINPDLVSLKAPDKSKIEAQTKKQGGQKIETGVTQTSNTKIYAYDASAKAYNTREKCENIGQNMCGERFIGVIFGGGICKITCNRSPASESK